MAVRLVCPCSVWEHGRLVPGLGCLTGPGRSAVFCGTVAGLDDRQARAVCWGDGSWGTRVLCLCPPGAEGAFGARVPVAYVCRVTLQGAGWRLRGASLAAVAGVGRFPALCGVPGAREQWLRAGPGPGLGQQGASGPCPLAVWSPRPILESRTALGLNTSPPLPPCPRPEPPPRLSVPGMFRSFACAPRGSLYRPRGRPQGRPTGSCWAAAGLMPAAV